MYLDFLSRYSDCQQSLKWNDDRSIENGMILKVNRYVDLYNTDRQ